MPTVIPANCLKYLPPGSLSNQTTLLSNYSTSFHTKNGAIMQTTECLCGFASVAVVIGSVWSVFRIVYQIRWHKDVLTLLLHTVVSFWELRKNMHNFIGPTTPSGWGFWL